MSALAYNSFCAKGPEKNRLGARGWAGWTFDFSMSLLDRYVFFEWLKIFVLALAAPLGILLLERLYDDLPDFINWGATTWETIKYFGLYAPSFLPTIIPHQPAHFAALLAG